MRSLPNPIKISWLGAKLETKWSPKKYDWVSTILFHAKSPSIGRIGGNVQDKAISSFQEERKVPVPKKSSWILFIYKDC